MNPDGSMNNEIYYMGIIDILQQFNSVKIFENFYKSNFTSQGRGKISALPAKDYAKRFVSFLKDSLK